MLLQALTLASVLAASVAHSDHAPRGYRENNVIARRDLEKRCGAQLADQRLRRRSALAKRSLDVEKRATADSVCTMTPEVTQGPYHILGELVRQNITEGQAGVPLEVQINVIDISTCEPIQVWIDAWHANVLPEPQATGYYSGYVAETGAALVQGSSSTTTTINSTSSGNTTMTGGMGGGGNSTMSAMSGGGGGAAPTSSSSNSSDYTTLSGADSEAAASQLDVDTTDDGTFLRGVWQSDADGLATMYSIVPGWYTGRAVHFHVKVYTNGSVAENGTFIATDLAHHVGQFFFDNTTMAAVAATSTYAANAITYADHTFNEADQWYPYQEVRRSAHYRLWSSVRTPLTEICSLQADGYDADMDITYVGSTVEEGLIGSITIGLNMSYSAVELSTQYADFDVAEYVSEGLDTTGVVATSTAASTSSSVASSSHASASSSHAATSSSHAATSSSHAAVSSSKTGFATSSTHRTSQKSTAKGKAAHHKTTKKGKKAKATPKHTHHA
ncbi:hypothetical protein P7C70_g8730, partial [Phenoliferia sp. Uapishka_3]